MVAMTKVERVIAEYLGVNFEQMPKEKLQERLDEGTVTREILAELKAGDIADHMAAVYNATAKEYIANPQNKGIIEELVLFMHMLQGGDFVLDIGCGPGRDALFMACADETFREGQMQRQKNGKRVVDTFEVPTKALRVIGSDISMQMLQYAARALCILARNNKTIDYIPMFLWDDMHKFRIGEVVGKEFFNGIWSCTSLFTHTAMDGAHILRTVAGLLKKDGIFFVSYTNGTADEHRYDRLLVSSTGHIKYFSQPNPKEIVRIADMAGLSLISETFSDFKRPNAPVKERLFVSQFYKKR